jgi:GT2 family glycosyltransferase
VITVDVLITSHNRCTKTLACLRSIEHQDVDLDLRILLVDAGSTDGTLDAVREQFPDVELVLADKDVFWGQGMRLAAARARKDADYHLWLNDDVHLDRTAFRTVLAEGQSDRIVVGVVTDEHGSVTYGGWVSDRWTPLSLRLVPMSDQPVPVDTLNGNVVLVGRAVRYAIGAVRGDLFPHAFGDIDYGFSARKAGFTVLQAPGTVGVCAGNPPPASLTLPTLKGRWRALVGMKELPPSVWWRACRRHGGVLGPAYFVVPYVKVLRPRGSAAS